MTIDELHQENSAKLREILDLEEILYNTHIVDLDDGSPCWCLIPEIYPGAEHEDSCSKAREATRPLYDKKTKEIPAPHHTAPQMPRVRQDDPVTRRMWNAPAPKDSDDAFDKVRAPK